MLREGWAVVKGNFFRMQMPERGRSLAVSVVSRKGTNEFKAPHLTHALRSGTGRAPVQMPLATPEWLR